MSVIFSNANKEFLNHFIAEEQQAGRCVQSNIKFSDSKSFGHGVGIRGLKLGKKLNVQRAAKVAIKEGAKVFLYSTTAVLAVEKGTLPAHILNNGYCVEVNKLFFL